MLDNGLYHSQTTLKSNKHLSSSSHYLHSHEVSDSVHSFNVSMYIKGILCFLFRRHILQGMAHTYEKDSPGTDFFFLFITVDFPDETGEVEKNEERNVPFLSLHWVMFPREIVSFWVPTTRNYRVAVRAMALNEQNMFREA